MKTALAILVVGALALAACTVIYRSTDVAVDRSERITGTNRINRLEITP